MVELPPEIAAAEVFVIDNKFADDVVTIPEFKFNNPETVTGELKVTPEALSKVKSAAPESALPVT